jgi:hypothetical protein
VGQHHPVLDHAVLPEHLSVLLPAAAQRGMLAAIAKAQRDKVISDRLKPQDLYGVITALTRMGTPEFTRLNPPSSTAAARTAVHDIVSQLVQP